MLLSDSSRATHSSMFDDTRKKRVYTLRLPSFAPRWHTSGIRGIRACLSEVFPLRKKSTLDATPGNSINVTETRVADMRPRHAHQPCNTRARRVDAFCRLTATLPRGSPASPRADFSIWHLARRAKIKKVAASTSV